MISFLQLSKNHNSFYVEISTKWNNTIQSIVEMNIIITWSSYILTILHEVVEADSQQREEFRKVEKFDVAGMSRAEECKISWRDKIVFKNVLSAFKLIYSYRVSQREQPRLELGQL